MSRAQFVTHLEPSGITLYHNGNAHWMYACGDLFAGHAISFLVGADGNFVGRAGLFG